MLLEAARQGADLSETDIVSQVDTFMFEVTKFSPPKFSPLDLNTNFGLMKIGPRHYIGGNYLVSVLHGDASTGTGIKCKQDGPGSRD